MPTKSMEDYLKTIYSLLEKYDRAIKTTEIAKELKVSEASVSEMISKLAEEKLVYHRPYKGVILTPDGIVFAEKVLRKHRLLEKFFVDILGFSKKEAHREAHKLEHAISDKTDKKISKFLGKPREGLTGEHIPKDKGNLVSLLELKKGEKGTIKILEGGRGAQRKIRLLGIREGKKVKIVTRHPIGGPIVVETGGCHIALGRGMAMKIWVEK